MSEQHPHGDGGHHGPGPGGHPGGGPAGHPGGVPAGHPGGDRGGHPGFSFDEAYKGRPPWDIGRPQREFVELQEEGLIRGDVLDVGCGTGENALMLAVCCHDVLGIDVAEMAVAEAQRKAAERGLEDRARFEVDDAVDMPVAGAAFETVIDCGFFHALDDVRRARFVDTLFELLDPGGLYLMLCFSDKVPGDWGPRRISEAEIRDAFAGERWEVRAVREAVLESAVPQMPEVPAWLAVVERL